MDGFAHIGRKLLYLPMLRPVGLILEIRLRQAWRSVKSVGALWILGLPLATVFYLSTLSTLGKQSTETVATLVLALPLLIHFNRRDLFFLEKQGFPLRLVLLAEYGLLSLVLALPVALLFEHYAALALTLTGALVIAFLPQWKHRTGSGQARPLIFLPYMAFEWHSAMRRYGWLFGLFYLPGLAFGSYTGAPLLSVVLITSLLPGVFDHCEPKELMEPFFFQPRGLWRKLGLHAALLILAILPLAVVFFIFSPEVWYLMLLALLIGLLYLAFAILYKYAHYFPGRRKVHNSLTAGLFALGLIIPFFAPACLVYLVVLFRKAKKKVVLIYG